MRVKHLILFTFFVACFATILWADADLALTLSDSPDPVMLGTDLTLSVTLLNQGPSAGTNTVLTVSLPPNMTFQSVESPDDWPCTTPTAETTGSITCTNASAAPGSTATILIVVKPSQIGMVTETATVASSEPDPNTDNNQATADTTVVTAQPGENEGTAGL